MSSLAGYASTALLLRKDDAGREVRYSTGVDAPGSDVIDSSVVSE